MEKQYTFKTTLIQPQDWVFAPLPADIIIEAVHPFGRTPVKATIDNKSWDTSIWTEKDGKSMIAVPKKIRGNLSKGDEVEITFLFDYERF
jgi:hypothetical protein